ncbi:hypothetical protein [Thiothrix sp.]|jgi:hypothetical protein|uniref:hypothetical protein n=1 Tax=Thiothrix sp. TaxID=1032 RepID=UPI0025795AFF|nr:hypothetical protein [Thiothrix sp.]
MKIDNKSSNIGLQGSNNYGIVNNNFYYKKSSFFKSKYPYIASIILLTLRGFYIDYTAPDTLKSNVAIPPPPTNSNHIDDKKILNSKSEQLPAKQQNFITYQEPTGVQVIFNKDGTIKKILASGEAELEFGDKKDERQALQRATLRAKASITKFLKESIKSNETIEEIQKIASNATVSGSKAATRETVKTTIETLENKAEEILQGIVTLEQNIDHEKKRVIVTVGMKEETIQAAKNLKSNIESSGETNPYPTASNADTTSEQHGQEIRRSNVMENF